jgi:xylan 1,4-beta-xylosidase
LRDVDRGFSMVAAFPELKARPIVIGESDPDGCAGCPASEFPQNGYRNSTLYASYTAASFARKHDLADLRGVNFEGALTWAFEFEDQPLFAGFRALATGGLDLPVLNVFRMFGRMSGQRVAVESSGAVTLETMRDRGVRSTPDVSALASRDGKKVYVLLWHYHDDDVAGPAAAVELTVAGLPAGARPSRIEHFRIDDDHSNAFSAWKRLGSPAEPTAAQYAQLEKAGQLTSMAAPEIVPTTGALRLTLPRQSVSLLVLEF